MTPRALQTKILKWFAVHGRKNLPWQKNISPYRVWVSEIMLQQTQVTTVIDYFERFMKRFPTVEALARANENDVLHLWTGLGYYARARNLHKTAKLIVKQYDGKFPNSVDALETMPGIGHSTAGAIISISFGTRAAILDGNVKRVLARFFGIDGWPGEPQTLKHLWKIAETYTPEKNCGDYTQAMMDLGATLCTRHRPRCDDCPLKSDCVAKENNPQEQLPTKKKSEKIPTKALFFLLLENKNGEILLEKRPATGIWGGLWSLPEYTDLEDIKNIIAKKYGVTVSEPTLLPEIKHTFSHYHLILKPVRLLIQRHLNKKQDPSIPPRSTQDDMMLATNQHIWYKTSSKTKIGLAAPIKKLLMTYEKNPLPKTKPRT